MSENNNKVYTVKKIESISLKETLLRIKGLWSYLLKRWLIICIFGFGGAALGLTTSLLLKPNYTAHLSFALIDNSSGGMGLASLASSFGFGDLGSNEGAFSGGNLLEIIKSRHSVEKTMLTPVLYGGKKQNLVEIYIQFTEKRAIWKKQQKNKELHTLSFPVGQSRESFTRSQDSIMESIYKEIVETGALSVNKKDKKTDMVSVDYTSGNELFSKIFVEKLMDETYTFYIETRTSQSRANIEIMQTTADSIKGLYEASLYRSASSSQFNINPALQMAAVPKIKQEANVQLYGAVYAEVLKNLETLKLDLAREKPIVQIIDKPRLPLQIIRLRKIKGIMIGGIGGGALIIFWLLGSLFLRNMMKEDN